MNHHEHDLGLAHDLPRLLGTPLRRRRMLGLLAGAGLLSLAGCATATGTTGAATGAVGEIPEETAGPYPGDGSNGPRAVSCGATSGRDSGRCPAPPTASR